MTTRPLGARGRLRRVEAPLGMANPHVPQRHAQNLTVWRSHRGSLREPLSGSSMKAAGFILREETLFHGRGNIVFERCGLGFHRELLQFSKVLSGTNSENQLMKVTFGKRNQRKAAARGPCPLCAVRRPANVRNNRKGGEPHDRLRDAISPRSADWRKPLKSGGTARTERAAALASCCRSQRKGHS